MTDRARLQLADALGSVNRWYCAEHFGWEVRDEETLVRYFVRSGGAADFARRWGEAMGILNRWYCSERYGRDVRDVYLLWAYYERARLGREASEGRGDDERAA